MKEYQVVRNVDIVTNIKAANEEEAYELALESEMAGKWMTEFQENYVQVDGVSIEQIRAIERKGGKVYRVCVMQAQLYFVYARSPEEAEKIVWEEEPKVADTVTRVQSIRIAKKNEAQHLSKEEHP
jgi:hypothetical protein